MSWPPDAWTDFCQTLTDLPVIVYASRETAVARAVAPDAIAVNPRLRRWPAERITAALAHECGHILWTWPAWTDEHNRMMREWHPAARDILNVLEDRRIEDLLADAGWDCTPLRDWVTENEAARAGEGGWTAAGVLAVVWHAGTLAVPQVWRAWAEAVWSIPVETLDDALAVAEAAYETRPRVGERQPSTASWVQFAALVSQLIVMEQNRFR